MDKLTVFIGGMIIGFITWMVIGIIILNSKPAVNLLYMLAIRGFK